MAKNTKLNALSIGSVVKVRENNALVDFVVAAKNYEPDRNAGLARDYTLLIRKKVLPDEVAWATSVDSKTDLGWSRNNCKLREWLETTYYQRLNEDARSSIVTINYYANDGATSGKLFVPGENDLGSAGFGDTVWNALVYSGKEWLRDRGDSQKEDGPDMENWWYTRVLLAERSGGKWDVRESYFPDAEYSWCASVRPCFAVGANTRISPEGELILGSAPTISSFYLNGCDLGSKDGPFRIEYTVSDPDEDDLTVTETLSGAKLRVWKTSGADKASGVIVITDAVWNVLDDDQYYDLKITVTDGENTVEWTTRFLKTKQRGYRVFAGVIDNTVNGRPITSGSYTFSSLECIYDPKDESETSDRTIILDPEVNLQKNDFGTFEFTLPYTNVYYDKITPRKTVIMIEEDGGELWTGYVTEISKNFKMDKVVYCKGEMGYLKDISMRLEAKEWTVKELFEAAVKATENAGIKSFRLGTVSEAFANEKVSTKDSGAQYTTVWDVIDSILIGNVGGIVRLRKRRDKTTDYGVGYTRHLDFLVDIEEKTDQTIEFAQNLLDLEYRINADELVNRVKVYGYETRGFWFWAKTSTIVETVDDEESIKNYGVCERCILVEGTSSTHESLKRAGQKYLNENNVGLTASFTINALDLRDAGVDVGRLCFLKRTHVVSEVHKIDDWPYCSALRIPLDAPEDKEFTFGETLESFTKKQAGTSAVAKRALDAVNSVISYVSNG